METPPKLAGIVDDDSKLRNIMHIINTHGAPNQPSAEKSWVIDTIARIILEHDYPSWAAATSACEHWSAGGGKCPRI